MPGSSDYFLTSAVTYSNEAKQTLLGVRGSTLEQHGAVSQETALEMAQGVREKVKANIALSTTGVAGPAGGTREVPTGTVWMAVASPSGSEARCLHFEGDREHVIGKATQAGLDWLRKALL